MEHKSRDNTSVVQKENSVEPKDVKRFSINIEALIGDKKEILSFSGPESASLGLIYDSAHRVLVEVSKIIKEKTDAFVEDNKKTDKEVEVEVVNK